MRLGSQMSTHVTSSAFVLPGLEADAEILVDRWGVPHIYAGSTDDAFRVQGFNIARERLWQIDYARRRGLGRVAAMLGPEHVERDRAARLFLYRGDTDAEWRDYGPTAADAARAWVEGVNAYIQLTRVDTSLLPAEFRELEYEPAFWDLGDLAAIRGRGFFLNLRQEVARALTIRDHGVAAESLRFRVEPPHEIAVPDGLDLTLIPHNVLRTYHLATLMPQIGVGGEAHSPRDQTAGGSNSWAVAGARTTTGRPILCSDPHRETGNLPGERYIAHLSAPGLDVIGAGEPVGPGISIGHNGSIAFGITFWPIDQEDLYVYRVNPENPLEYRYDGDWEAMTVIIEQIPVKDGPPVEAELRFTRHGPVIFEDGPTNTAFAVRAAWLAPGTAPYLRGIEVMGAKDWQSFLAAVDGWGAPPEVHVFADIAGNIGWKAAGLAPIRPNWDGLLPVPGDGQYEWAGFHPAQEFPVRFNPPNGWIATANEMNISQDGARHLNIGYEWKPRYRKQRIDDVLAARQHSSVEDMLALQTDVLSIPAQSILTAVRQLDIPATPELDMLLRWDGHLTTDSAAAALFEVWYRRHLRPELLRTALRRIVPAHEVDAAMKRMATRDSRGDPRVDLDLVEDARAMIGTDNPGLIDIVERTLRSAVADIERLLGTARSGWSWGRLHSAHVRHPLSPVLTSLPWDQLAAGPLPQQGSGDTVCNTLYASGFRQVHGATFRVVIDVGSWDESRAMNAPGQSGQLDGHKSTSLFEPWMRGESFPLLYSRAAVQDATEHVITLRPA